MSKSDLSWGRNTDKWATQTSLGFDPHSREVPHYTTVSCRKPNEALERGTSQLTDDIECSEREEKPSCFNERTYSRLRDREESMGWSKEAERPVARSSSMNITDAINKTLTPPASEGSQLEIISRYAVGIFAQTLHLPIIVRRVGCLIRDVPGPSGTNILCVIQYPQG